MSSRKALVDYVVQGLVDFGKDWVAELQTYDWLLPADRDEVMRRMVRLWQRAGTSRSAQADPVVEAPPRAPLAREPSVVPVAPQGGDSESEGPVESESESESGSDVDTEKEAKALEKKLVTPPPIADPKGKKKAAPRSPSPVTPRVSPRTRKTFKSQPIVVDTDSDIPAPERVLVESREKGKKSKKQPSLVAKFVDTPEGRMLLEEQVILGTGYPVPALLAHKCKWLFWSMC